MACITCCFGCSERVLGCHSTCQKYIKEKEEHRKASHEKFLYEMSIRAGMKESVNRMKKKRCTNGITVCHKRNTNVV